MESKVVQFSSALSERERDPLRRGGGVVVVVIRLDVHVEADPASPDLSMRSLSTSRDPCVGQPLVGETHCNLLG